MQDPLLGYQLGSYRLVEILGQGSFAQVYRGKHVHIDVFAAIKVLRTQFGDQEKENFRTEAVLLTKLKHERIIRFLDYGFIGGRPYLITDLAEKGSLNRIHPRGTRLPLQQIVGYVEQIAAGLDFAHTQHVIHRDVKPENILVSDSGALLLADFGIAKMLGTSGSSYLTSSMSGTLPYMAPELFDGRPSAPSDQYALGVMVYEWLTGRFPFDGSAGELVKHHLQDPPPPLRSLQPSISPEIEMVVQMALRKEPDKRFRTVQAFANALRQASITRPRVGGTQQTHPMPPIKQQSRVANPAQPPTDPQAPPQRLPVSPAPPRVANPVPPPSPAQPLPGGASPQNKQPLPSDPQSPAGASSGPLSPNRQPLPSDPQSPAGASGALLSVSAPLASDPGNQSSQPLSTDPASSPRVDIADDWQKLLPPQQSLSFTQLPALPQALLTDFWWPTFIVAPEQRREINQGTISSEMLSALGPLTSFPSLSVPLPVSSTSKPLSIGRLDAAQRISGGTPAASRPASRPQPAPAPALAPIGTGRVAPAAQAQNQPAAPAQPGVPRSAARTAQAATAGAKKLPTSATRSPSAAGAVTIAFITIIIGFIGTIGAASSNISAVIVSWIFLGIGLISSSIGIKQAGSRTSVKIWLIVFLIVALILAIINIPILISLNSR